MAHDHIVIRGAREHNLKRIDLDIPRDRLVVITGLSGSGKSSLAFDTIYAEGQRRYVESLSAYARQFLGQLNKPDVDLIEGLSPAISIDQKGVSSNPRSTVGTVTEIFDYLRLLFARVGQPHCPKCGKPIEQQTIEQIVDQIAGLENGTRLMLLAPLVKDRKGEHESVFEDARRMGFSRARVDGKIIELSDEIKLKRTYRHTIEVVVDRLVTGPGFASEDRSRLADSVETALRIGSGTAIASVVGGEDLLFSENFACPTCGISILELEPRSFSFNSPHGACSVCSGLGVMLEVDSGLVVPNAALSINQGALHPWRSRSAGNSNGWMRDLIKSVANHDGFSLDTPFHQLLDSEQRLVLYGSGGKRYAVSHIDSRGRTHSFNASYEGVITNLARLYRQTESEWRRHEIGRYMSYRNCPACQGQRLKPESLAVTINGKSIIEVTAHSIHEAMDWFAKVEGSFTENQRTIARQVLKEIRARLGFLIDVGLNYLSLDRRASTLSGGEAQRIRLATQIGSSLMGVLYILDEPSIGLHQRDNRRLIETLVRLRDVGNTVLVVEHDEETIRAADFVIDIGPGAGKHGGEIVVAGPVEDVESHPGSITGQYLAGQAEISVPTFRRAGNGKHLVVRGARENNLKDIDVDIPLGMFVCVTGVSGSGKSTLISDILYRKLAQSIYQSRERPGSHDGISGLEELDKAINVDQSPIGRTPRSNPATYTGLFTPVRELFASVPESKIRGYKPGRFSFNVKGGRCEACDGDGIIKIEMQFLPDIYVPCEVCKGKRYNREALEVLYHGKTIAEVLEMTVSEALEFYQNIPKVRKKLSVLEDVGLGYIHLGQPATTLSGGEAQRIKLATELSKRATGRTLYILDEPTTGLHFADVGRLLDVLQRLVDAGNTVVVIEHNLDVIKCADWIIDLGPEGGDAGGEVVAAGTPEEVAEMSASYTGQWLRRYVETHRRVPAGVAG